MTSVCPATRGGAMASHGCFWFDVGSVPGEGPITDQQSRTPLGSRSSQRVGVAIAFNGRRIFPAAWPYFFRYSNQNHRPVPTINATDSANVQTFTVGATK